jgi:folate-binding protein YgfZ
MVVASTHEALVQGLSSRVVFSDPWPRVGSGSVGYAEDVHPGHEWELYSAVISAGGAHAQLSVPADCDPSTWTPLYCRSTADDGDVDDKTLPHELDWLRTAVHLNKGCYRGQEAVAKVHNLGTHPDESPFCTSMVQNPCCPPQVTRSCWARRPWVA